MLPTQKALILECPTAPLDMAPLLAMLLTLKAVAATHKVLVLTQKAWLQLLREDTPTVKEDIQLQAAITNTLKVSQTLKILPVNISISQVMAILGLQVTLIL
jgi:hypothetical protein